MRTSQPRGSKMTPGKFNADANSGFRPILGNLAELTAETLTPILNVLCHISEYTEINTSLAEKSASTFNSVYGSLMSRRSNTTSTRFLIEHYSINSYSNLIKRYSFLKFSRQYNIPMLSSFTTAVPYFPYFSTWPFWWRPHRARWTVGCRYRRG